MENLTVVAEQNERTSEALMLHNQILATGQAINNLLCDFCAKLKCMRDEKLYLELGHESFDAYAEERCSMKARQAYTYIKAYEDLGERMLIEQAGVGITKLALLTQITPTERASFAEENDLTALSVTEVKALIEKANDAGEQLSMLEAEKQDAENSEKFLKNEVARLQRVMEEERVKAELDLKVARENMEAKVQERAAAAIRDAREQAEAKAKVGEAERTAQEVKKARKAAADEAKKALEAEREKLSAQHRQEVARAEEQVLERAAKEHEKAMAIAAEEAEKLRRQMASAVDADSIKFSALFEQLQATARQMAAEVERIATAGQKEKAEKLSRALHLGLEQLMNKF